MNFLRHSRWFLLLVAEESFIGPRYYCWKTTSKQHIDIKSIGYWRQIEAKTIDVKTILKCRYSSTLCFNDNTVLDGCSTVLRYHRSSIISRILALFGKYCISRYQGNLSLQNSCSFMQKTYLRLSACKESAQLVLERESKGLKVSNVRSSCTMISSTKTLFPRFAFCLRFKYVLRPHVLGLQVFGF